MTDEQQPASRQELHEEADRDRVRDPRLVDELRLMVFPVSTGAGLRLFPEDQVKLPWRRVDSVEFPTGVRADTYHPAG